MTIFIAVALGATSLAPAAARDFECDGRKATIVGTPGDDLLKGTIDDDVIFGRGGNDRIRGIGGRDLLCGGNGDDHLDGGPNSDFVYGEGGDDVIGGGNGYDTLVGQGGNDEVDGGGGLDAYSFHESDVPVDLDLQDGTATGEGTDSLSSIKEIFASPRGGTYRGSDARQIFWTMGPGTYSIEGRGGNDTVYGQEDTGALTADGGEGDDHIEAFGATEDSLDGGPGDDELLSAKGNDTLDGDSGDDDLVDALGTNQLVGGPGIDTLRFGYSHSFVEVDLHSGVEIDLAAGTVMGDGMAATISTVENVFGTIYDDSLFGDGFGNGLFGGRGDDLLDGREGNDFLDGGSNEDELHGGDGDDFLNGGTRNRYLGHNQGDGDPDQLYADDGTDYCNGYDHDELESCETIVVE